MDNTSPDRQTTTLPRRLILTITALADSVILSLVALFGPIIGALVALGSAVTLYCAFSPIGFVLILTLISPITGYAASDTGTVYAIKWAVTLVFLALTLAQWAFRRKPFRLNVGSVERQFLIFVGWGVLCSLFALRPVSSLQESLRLLLLLPVYVIAKETIDRKSHLRLVFAAVMVAVVVEALASGVELSTRGFLRIRGLTGNPNFLGQCLMFAIPILAIAASVYKSALSKLLLLSVLVTAAAMLLLTWSRDAILCVGIQSLAFLLLERKKRILLGLLTALLLAATLTVASPGARDVVSKLLRLQSGTTRRTLMWNVGLRASGRNPITGMGYNVRIVDAADRIMWNDLAQRAQFSNTEDLFYPHNAYIYTLMTVGVPGLILLLMLYGHIIKDQYASFKLAQTPALRRTHAIMVSVLIGALFHGLFETGNILGFSSTANYFWITLGMAEAIKRKNLLTN